jgi:acyl carrier protein
MTTTKNKKSEVAYSREKIAAEVRRLIAEPCDMPVENIHEDSKLLELPWDSLDIVECVMEVEEEFDISVSDGVVDQAKTVGDLIDGVCALLAGEKTE